MSTRVLLTFLIITFFSQGVVHAQGTYWVYLTDKAGTPHSIQNPKTFLSERAIQRRVNQHIPLVEGDLPVSPVYRETVEELAGVEVRYASKWLNALTVKSDDQSSLDQIRSLPFVHEVVPVRRYNVQLEDVIDPIIAMGSQTGKTYDYGNSIDQISMLGLDYMHELGFTGRGLHIALFDAGFLSSVEIDAHKHIGQDKRWLGVKDFVEGDSLYDSTHGTFVLSVIAARIPGDMIGAAPDASFWLLRTEDGDSETLQEEINWLAAAEFADSAGVDIINSSLGYTVFDDSTQNHTYDDLDGNTTIVTRAADLAASKGILVVTSAGNLGNQPWKYIGAPADADSVLAVGAVDSTRAPAILTSHGPSVDGRVKPDVAAMGWRTTLASLGGGSFKSNGTSFSAPLVAGAAACLWQAFPDIDAHILREAIQRSAHQYDNPDTLLGYGIPDLRKAYQLLIDSILKSNEALLTAYPNPYADQLNLVMVVRESMEAEVSVIDVLGKTVFTEKRQLIEGLNHLDVDAEQLNQGTYIILVDTPVGKFTSTVIRIR